jgi:hypothetical protein
MDFYIQPVRDQEREATELLARFVLSRSRRKRTLDEQPGKARGVKAGTVLEQESPVLGVVSQELA